MEEARNNKPLTRRVLDGILKLLKGGLIIICACCLNILGMSIIDAFLSVMYIYYDTPVYVLMGINLTFTAMIYLAVKNDTAENERDEFNKLKLKYTKALVKPLIGVYITMFLIIILRGGQSSQLSRGDQFSQMSRYAWDNSADHT